MAGNSWIWKRASGTLALALVLAAPLRSAPPGTHSYDDFASPEKDCRRCHRQIYHQWKQSMMSRCFVHRWDEVEYFKLALPHALKSAKVAGVKAGCIGCHSPLAYAAGDIPPKPVAEGTRANEGVTCEVCHNITGSTEPVPFNFSFVLKPGGPKTGRRQGTKTKHHGISYSPFLRSAELCGTCHDELSPYGAWVKETYREWRAGPYSKEGVRCQDCHMYHAEGKNALGGKTYPDVAQHVFHGSHFPGKLAGVIDLALYGNKETVLPGQTVTFTAVLFNGKAGHYVPSGSSEERMLYLEVWLKTPEGKKLHLPVDPQGFPGEEYTIADPAALAYQAMGEIMGIEGFKGVSRDGDVPAGARIFRRPFFDPKGRMTICQWYTAKNDVVDWRIGPRSTKIEQYTWQVPEKIQAGIATVTALLKYSQVPSSVGRFLKLPPEEYEPILVNKARLELRIKR